MTTVQLQIAEIRRARAQIDPARLFLTVLAGLFWVPGWVARKIVLALWWVVSYAVIAMVTGWKAAAPPDRGGG